MKNEKFIKFIDTIAVMAMKTAKYLQGIRIDTCKYIIIHEVIILRVHNYNIIQLN